MRRPSQDARLPPIVVQVFGMLIVVAIAVVAIREKDNGLLYALLGLAGGALGINAFSEKASHTVKEALKPGKPEEQETDS